MISGEMRELLSAYVDGELRDTDAVRVEEMTKGDPKLRREIDAYRSLRTRLRDWDEAEHGGDLSDAARAAVMRRVRTYARTLASARRGRVVGLLAHPLAAAAGLLLAAGLGIFFARGHEPAAPGIAPPGSTLAVQPAAGIRPLDVASVEVEPFRFPPRQGDLFYVLEPIEDYAKGVWVEGDVVHPRSIVMMREMRLEEERIERIRARRKPERRTSEMPMNPAVSAMVAGYHRFERPLASLVYFRQAAGRTAVGRFSQLPLGVPIAMDPPVQTNRVLVTNEASRPALLLLGEVLVGVKDRSLRTRVVTSSHWIRGRDQGLVRMAWADEIARPTGGGPGTMTSRLEGQLTILGPKARKRLLGFEGRDKDLIGWLQANYGQSLGLALSRNETRSRSAVSRLVDALRRDPDATGFAVTSGEKILGIELFASHELMMAYAPRLLHGYAAEAGPKALGLEGGGAELVARLQRYMDDLPRSIATVEELSRADAPWPSGLRKVNLKNGKRIMGHGLLQDDRPVHVTLFVD